MSDQPTDPNLTPPDDTALTPEQNPGDGSGSTKRRSAADIVMGKTTRMAKTATRTVQATVKDAKEQKDKTIVVVVVIASMVVLGLFAMAVLVKKKAAAPVQTEIPAQFAVPMSAQEEMRGFVAKTAGKVTEQEGKLNDLIAKVDSLAKKREDDAAMMRQVLNEAVDRFKKESDARMASMDELMKHGGGRAGMADGGDPRAGAILTEFQSKLADRTLPPAEAKARAYQALRDAGFSDDKIRDMLAEASTKAGLIAVGNVVEAPISEAERQTLPDLVRPQLDGVRGLLYGLAQTEGRLYPEQSYDEVKTQLRISVKPEKRAEITDQVVKSVADTCRVRRENITPEMEEVIPFLVAQREAKNVDRTNKAAVARLVWEYRDRLGDDVMPGQLLTVAQTVARTIGPTTRAKEDLSTKPLDDSGEKFATEVVSSAALNALNMGRNQQEQMVVSAKALDQYLQTSRYTATDEQKRRVINRAMASALQRKQGGPALPSAVPGPDTKVSVPIGTTVPIAVPAVDPDANYLFFGPLKLDRIQVAKALFFATPSLLKASGTDLTKPSGVAALVGAWEQIPRIVQDHLPARLGEPLGGRTFMVEVLPELLLAARTAEPLGNIKLRLGADPSLDDTPEGAIAHGAAVGAIYGPLLHDGDKAKAAAVEAAPAMEAQKPLTATGVALIKAAPTPIAKALAAYELVRPQRFGYPAERYREMAERLEGLRGQATDLQDALKGYVDGDGKFAEDIRLLLPLAVVAHDDGRLAVDEVMKAVRQEVIDFGLLTVAERIAGRTVGDEIVPRYAVAMVDASGGSQAIVALANDLVAHKTYEVYQNYRGQIQASQIPATAQEIATTALPWIEQSIVREVVVGRVLPRITKPGQPAQYREKAIAHTRARAAELVQPAYTPPRIDEWASQISEEARRILDGTDVVTTGPANQPNQPNQPGGRRPTSIWPAPTMIQASPGGQLIGTTTTMVKSRKVVIPGGSYANAFLLTGVDAEVGGRSNLPVMTQVDLSWRGPAGSLLPMRGARLIGTANAMAGPERIAIDLTRLSYVLGSGRELSAKCVAYVNDNIDGQYGALGHYVWNADRVLPMAMLSGFGKGAADALKATTNTQIVTTTGVVNSVSPTDAGQNALIGGAAEGFGILSDYVKDVLKDVHPSVSAKNGQRLSVWLGEPIELDLTESEYNELSSNVSTGGFAP